MFWTITGVVIAVIGTFIAYLQLVQKPRRKRKKQTGSRQTFSGSALHHSSVNTVHGDKVNFNQTIINHVKDTVRETVEKNNDPDILIPEFERAKKKIARERQLLRTYIFAIIASAKTQNLDHLLEVRHIQDAIEDLITVDEKVTLTELKQLKEEGIIDLYEKDHDNFIGPYSKVITHKKFYDYIR